MPLTPTHQSQIIITPKTYKEQIIIRLRTLVGREGGSYFPTNGHGDAAPLAVIEGMEIHGLEAKGQHLYLMGVPSDENISVNLDDEMEPYNADQFYIEQLWQIYLACEPIYQHKFLDYASASQDN